MFSTLFPTRSCGRQLSSAQLSSAGSHAGLRTAEPATTPLLWLPFGAWEKNPLYLPHVKQSASENGEENREKGEQHFPHGQSVDAAPAAAVSLAGSLRPLSTPQQRYWSGDTRSLPSRYFPLQSFAGNVTLVPIPPPSPATRDPAAFPSGTWSYAPPPASSTTKYQIMKYQILEGMAWITITIILY